MTTIAETTKHDIVAAALLEHAGGKSLRQIAATIGISHESLRNWMLDEQPAEYRLAQRKALIQRVVEADEMLESAADGFDIARAREIAKFSRWDAERRLPQLFGAKLDVTLTERIDLKGALDEAKRRIVTIENPPQVGNVALLPANTTDPADI